MVKRSAVLLFALLFLSLAGFSQDRKPFEIVKVADGVLLLIDPEPTRDIVMGNSIAIIGDDGVLVFDTNFVPSVTRRMLAEIRKATDKPVRFVVNSHWHWDHPNGNHVYREAFPQVDIIAHPETRKEMDKQNPQYLEFAVKRREAFLKSLNSQLSSGKKENGTTLSEYEKLRLSQAIKDVETYYSEFDTLKYISPNLTFDNRLTLHLGSREVQLLHFGRGNTAGDVAAFLPKEKILITGDLLVHPVPYSFGSFLSEWIKTLRKMADLNPALIIPGHGPVQRDQAYLTQVINLLEATVKQVRDAAQKGLSLEETRKAVDLEAFRLRFAGDDPARNFAFQNYFFIPATERAYKEAKGEIK